MIARSALTQRTTARPGHEGARYLGFLSDRSRCTSRPSAPHSLGTCTGTHFQVPRQPSRQQTLLGLAHRDMGSRFRIREVRGVEELEPQEGVEDRTSQGSLVCSYSGLELRQPPPNFNHRRDRMDDCGQSTQLEKGNDLLHRCAYPRCTTARAFRTPPARS